MSLTNPTRTNMRKWLVDGEEVTLWENAYLILQQETGRLGFVRLKNVQTKDFFGRGNFNDTFALAGISWRVGVEFASSLEDLKKWNVKFYISQAQRSVGSIELLCYFDLRELTVVGVVYPKDASSFLPLGSAINNKSARLPVILRDYLLEPHRHRWSLYRQEPNDFFEHMGRRIALRLHKLGEALVLSARRRF